MNVEQALTIADTLDASEPEQHRALGSLAAEVRRLREREAKAREILQAHVAEYVRTDTDEGVARAAERVAIWMDAARWLAEGE